MAYQLDKFKYHSVHGDEGLVLDFAEAAAQTFKRGDLVILTGGKLVLETSPAAANVLGFALADATGVTDTRIGVQIIRQDDVFIVPFQADDAFLVAEVGVAQDFVRNATAEQWEVNTDSQAAAFAVVLGTPEIDGTGNVVPSLGGPVFVKFLNADTTFGTL